MAAKQKTAKAEAVKFQKEQLLTFAKYKHRRDLIGALLEDGVAYSTTEVNAMIEKFMKGAK